MRLDNTPHGAARIYGVPATRLAEDLGRKMVLKVVMVGFFGAITKVLEAESLRQAVNDSVPPAFQKLNLQAFEKGWEYGGKLLDKLAHSGETEGHLVALESEA